MLQSLEPAAPPRQGIHRRGSPQDCFCLFSASTCHADAGDDGREAEQTASALRNSRRGAYFGCEDFAQESTPEEMASTTTRPSRQGAVCEELAVEAFFAAFTDFEKVSLANGELRDTVKLHCSLLPCGDQPHPEASQIVDARILSAW